MREMKDSGIEWIGKIPGEWKLQRGKYLFSQRNEKGNNINLQLLSPTQRFGVIPQKMYEGLSGMTAVKLNEKTDLNLMKTIHKGDFCISLRSFQGGFEYSNYEGVVSPAYQVFYPIVDISERYYKYLFKDCGFIDRMNSYTMTLRDGKNISFSDFGNTYIPYPPLSTQHSIADFLDRKCSEIDSLTADIEKQIETLEQYKKSIITEAVTKGLDLDAEMKDSGVEYIGETPIDWDVIRLKYILRERNERSSFGNEELLSVSQYQGVVPSSTLNKSTMQANSLVGYKKVFQGDLVFNKLNPGLARFGCSYYDGITSPDFSVYIVEDNCNAKYLQYLLKTDKYVSQFKGAGLGVGDGFARLYTNQLYEFFVSLPNIEEINQIVNYLDHKCAAIDSVITDKKSQLDTLAEYKKSIIYEYVTGKKEVPAS